MSLSVAVLCLLSLGRALAAVPDWDGDIVSNDVSEGVVPPPPAAPAGPAPVLALRLRPEGAGELTLRPATEQQTQLFEDVVGPLELISLVSGASRGSTRARAVSPRGAAPPPPRSAQAARRAAHQLWEIVNKFVVCGAAQRGQELRDAVDARADTTLTILVRGASGLIVLAGERQQWRFALRPPSPLPAWLHADSTPRAQRAHAVPADVQNELYVTLLRLMRVFLRFDL